MSHDLEASAALSAFDHRNSATDSAAASVSRQLPLIDSFGRVHRSLRISVTDRCNIRCQYCMPEVAQFMQPDRLLTFEEMAAFVEVVATLGIRKLRITGGEPLMRPELPNLLGLLSQVNGIEDIALTTNGMLLAEQIDELVAAGLKRVNISLDTLSESTFHQLSRRHGIDKVIAGIDAAHAQSGLTVRLNALVMRDINFADVLPLVHFARERNVAIRFIEFMPLDAERAWSREQMVSGDEMRRVIEATFGQLVKRGETDPSQPATDFTFADHRGVVGFIDSVSRPFCSGCDRLRLTADGKLRNCLFSREEWDVRSAIRDGSGEALVSIVRQCLVAKRAAHGIDAVDFVPPERAMFQIGG